MSHSLFELAVVIVLAATAGIFAKALRQPVVLAYLATGAFIGYFQFFNLAHQETFHLFSELGIMFLLFLVGLEVNYHSLRLVGKTSVVIGLGQILFTSIIGFLLAKVLNFAPLAALYIGVALTFSSTIIIVKLLTDKKDMSSLYGKISLGILLVQDVIAIFTLVILSGIESGGGIVWMDLITTLIKALSLFFFVFFLSKRFLPHLVSRLARSQELLFLSCLAWLFLFAALAEKLGFSIEIAGLLAGMALANSGENVQVSAKFRSLRDFFILIFFVILGSSIVFSDFHGLTLPIALLSLFVLIGNPFIVLVLMGLLGYRSRTSFLSGMTVAQVSEFSLILVAVGAQLGHIGENVVALITAVGVITITLSSYLIMHAEVIFKHIRKILKLFERQHTRRERAPQEEFNKEIIMIGCHRTGRSIVAHLAKEKLLIIDFDPEVMEYCRRQGIECLFGDVQDSEIVEKANFEAAKLVISTSPDTHDNLAILSEVRKLEKKPKVILRAETEEDARYLYRAGADYVLLPHLTAGQYLGKSIAIDSSMDILAELRSQDLALTSH